MRGILSAKVNKGNSQLSSPESTKQPRGIARVDARFGNVPAYDTAGTDYNVIANADRKHSCVGSDRNGVSHTRRLPLRSIASRRAARAEGIVHEHNAVPNEAIVAEGDEITDERMRLYSAAVAYRSTSLNLDEWPYEAVGAYGASINVHRLYDLTTRSEDGVDDAGRQPNRRVGFPRVHLGCPKRQRCGEKRNGTERPVSTDS